MAAQMKIAKLTELGKELGLTDKEVIAYFSKFQDSFIINDDKCADLHGAFKLELVT